MATETKLSLAEFLGADYGREVELVDGELWERNELFAKLDASRVPR